MVNTGSNTKSQSRQSRLPLKYKETTIINSMLVCLHLPRKIIIPRTPSNTAEWIIIIHMHTNSSITSDMHTM